MTPLRRSTKRSLTKTPRPARRTFSQLSKVNFSRATRACGLAGEKRNGRKFRGCG